MLLLGVTLLATAGGRPGLAADIEYGAYLAQECSSCHAKNSNASGIPDIAGLPMDYFIQALSWYKEGARENATMQTVARSLDDEQIAALAAYYAQE
jgi:cytochrome c